MKFMNCYSNLFAVLNSHHLFKRAGLGTLACFAMLFSTTPLFAQCPVGETEITIEFGSGSFNSEIGWALVDGEGTTVLEEGFGEFSANTTLVECIPSGNYEFQAFDSFGDGWGATVTITSSEDYSVNGCAAGDQSQAPGTVVLPTTSPGGSSETFDLGDLGCNPGTPPAGCPAGETEITIEFGSGAFNSEIGWALVDCEGTTVLEEGFGEFSANETIIECIPSATYEFQAFDSFGDGWGATVTITSSEDYSVNGCAAGDQLQAPGTVVLPTTSPVGSSETFDLGDLGCSTAPGPFCVPAPPPANDLCADAIAIDCDETLSGTTNDATFDDVGFCGTTNTAPGVWYIFAGTGEHITASLCNQASFDTKIAVFSGTCASLICEAGNDDGSGCSGFTSEVEFSSVVGTDYYILVHGFGTNTGDFDLTVTCAAPPPAVENDDCADAIAIDCDETLSGTTNGATFDDVGFCGTTNTAPGVWYIFAGTGEDITASLCDQASFDTKIAVFSGTCASLICEAGNDDGPGCSGFTSEVEFSSVVGTDYYILVHGFGTNTGDFDLTVTCAAPPMPPVNDNVCDALSLTIGVAEHVDGTLATAENGEPNPGAGTGANSCQSQDGWCSFELDVDNSTWFTFTAPASGKVTVETIENGSGSDTQLAIWEVGDCSSFSTFTPIAGNDDIDGSNFISRVEDLCLTPGALYYVQVDGFNGNEYDVNVLVTAGTNEVPSISCSPNFNQGTDAGVCTAEVTIPVPVVTDDCGYVLEFRYRPVNADNSNAGPWSAWMDETQNVQTFLVGRYKIRWRATDNIGQNKGCTRYLDVEDDEYPDAQCKDIDIDLVGGEATISPEDIDNGSSDNCGIYSLTASEVNFGCSNSGAQTVTLTVMDVNGLSSTCEAGINVTTNSLSVGDVSKNEGTGNGFTFYLMPVTRDNNDCTFTVDYTTADGTATIADNDYQILSGSMYFPAGGSFTQYAIVRVVRDATYESDEDFSVTISDPSIGVNITDGTGEAIIINDDGAPVAGNEPNVVQEAVAAPLEVGKVITYPNPTMGNVNVRTPAWWFEQGNVAVSLFDAVGHQLAAFELHTSQSSIDFSQLEAGNYFLSFELANGEKVTQRVVKH